jgi:hypothetical protein
MVLNISTKINIDDSNNNGFDASYSRATNQSKNRHCHYHNKNIWGYLEDWWVQSMAQLNIELV